MKTLLSPRNPTRYALGILLLFMALNAFAGGYYGMAGAKDVPLDWLSGSPFPNYFIPGAVLFFGVGGSLLLAAIAVFKRSGVDRKAAFIAGGIMLLCLGIQIAIIGYVSWMQPATAIAALMIFILTWMLPGHE